MRFTRTRHSAIVHPASSSQLAEVHDRVRSFGGDNTMRLYYTLADYPHELVEIECAKCGRHGRLRTARLLAEHGPDIKLRTLRC